MAHVSGGSVLVRNSRWRRRRLLILCYHGVAIEDEHGWRPERYITATRLGERLALLRDLRANVLPLGEALERLGDGTLPPRAVAITFDDGAADFHVRALPVLQEYQVPATVYLTTYYVQRAGLPVWNVAASYVLWQARANGVVDLEGVTAGGGPFDLTTEPGRHQAWRAFSERWTGEPTEAKDLAIDQLAARVGVDLAAIRRKRQLQLMTPEEVSSLPSDLVQVELHTHRHRTPLDAVLFRRELDDNSAMIRELTGREPRHFCYPSGRVRREFLPWLRDAGVQSATTCVPGLARPTGDPLLIPRLIDTTHTPVETFAGWVTGVAAWLPNRTRTDVAADVGVMAT
jgi:peptidoglycan/xylan/chitin deacetylase (PgdA/CDA1 family)